MVNIHDAKAKLSEYLEAAERGERVLICKRNRPVAELRALPAARLTPRPIGLAKGQITVPPSFFDPLPDDLLDAFEGKSSPEPQVPPSPARPNQEAGPRRRPAAKRRPR